MQRTSFFIKKKKSSISASKIQISAETHMMLEMCGGFVCIPRGEVEIKVSKNTFFHLLLFLHI